MPRLLRAGVRDGRQTSPCDPKPSTQFLLARPGDLVELGLELVEVPSKVSARGLSGWGDKTLCSPTGEGRARYSTLLGGFARADQRSARVFRHARESDTRPATAIRAFGSLVAFGSLAVGHLGR